MVWDQPHRPLLTCNVFYLGNMNLGNEMGPMEMVEYALKKAYPVHQTETLRGINTNMTVYTSGIQLQHVSSPSVVYWFPIQKLYITAAKKCVVQRDVTGQRRSAAFYDVNSPEAQQSSHAPLFMFSYKSAESGSIHSHSFMTKNDEMSLQLVEATRQAYINRGGHSSDAIPAEVAANEVQIDDDESDDSSTEGGVGLRVVNIDEAHMQHDLYPTSLVTELKLSESRPNRNSNSLQKSVNGSQMYRERSVPNARPGEEGPPTYRSYPTAAPGGYRPPPLHSGFESYGRSETQRPRSPGRTRVIRPPPIYIRAPPPRVIQGPPQIQRHVIRQPVYYPVERIVEKPVPVEVPGPTPPPEIIEREKIVPVRAPTPEPEIVEVPVYLEGPTQYVREPPEIVHVPVMQPPPPPEFIEVPVYIQSPPEIIRAPPEIREIEVPMPYEVPSPPEIREVYIERPPVVIPGPTEVEIQEVPVPYPVPYEVPVYNTVEVPHFLPIPVKGKKHKNERRWREPMVHDRDLFREGYPRYSSFYPDFHQQYEHQFWRQNQRLPRRKQRRRSSSSSSSSRSSSSSTSQERRQHRYRPDYPYHLSDEMQGLRITEIDDYGRPTRTASPRRRGEQSPRRSGRGRESRQDTTDDVDGYDFYRPIPNMDNEYSERRSKKERGHHKDYRRKARFDESRTTEDSNGRYAFTPDIDYRFGRQMPAHLSESISEQPRHHRGRHSVY